MDPAQILDLPKVATIPDGLHLRHMVELTAFFQKLTARLWRDSHLYHQVRVRSARHREFQVRREAKP